MRKFEMKYFMGKPLEEWMKEPEASKLTQQQAPLNHNAPKKEDFIYVPSINLYVAKEKIMHGLDWSDTHKELAKEKGRKMPTPYEFTEFIRYLLANPNGTNDASKDEIQLIANEFLEKRDPWRAEHLDAYFEKRKDGMYILTKNKSIANKLDAPITNDCYVELSFNNQGMPIKKSSNQNYVQGENIYHYCLRAGSVAWFYADSGGADLYCGGIPTNSDSSLGVRPVSQRV